MSITQTNTTGIAPEALADLEAVIQNLIAGIPVAPDLKRRVEVRADRITEEIRQKHGDIDVDQLLRDALDEI
jgi:hypothetical protein